MQGLDGVRGKSYFRDHEAPYSSAHVHATIEQGASTSSMPHSSSAARRT